MLHSDFWWWCSVTYRAYLSCKPRQSWDKFSIRFRWRQCICQSPPRYLFLTSHQRISMSIDHTMSWMLHRADFLWNRMDRRDKNNRRNWESLTTSAYVTRFPLREVASPISCQLVYNENRVQFDWKLSESAFPQYHAQASSWTPSGNCGNRSTTVKTMAPG